MIEAPTTERPVFEPVFDAEPDAGFEPVAPPYDHEVDLQIEPVRAPVVRAGRRAPSRARRRARRRARLEPEPVGAGRARGARVHGRGRLRRFAARGRDVGADRLAARVHRGVAAVRRRFRTDSSAAARSERAEHPAPPPPAAAPMPAPAAGPVAEPTGTRAGGQEIPLVESTPLSRRVPGAAFSGTPDAGASGQRPSRRPKLRRPPSSRRPTDRRPTDHRRRGRRSTADAGPAPVPQAAPPSAPRLDGEPRPRPERVHDLLARHLRGIREGRTGVTHADDHAEERAGMEDDR